MGEPNKRILIVDDDADHLFVTRALLEHEGYEVLTHQSPFGVTGLIQASSPDLVLMDVNLPAFSGADLAAHLRADERTRSIPVVLYSSADEKVLSAAVAKHRLPGYISKGDLSELRRKVSYFLGDLAKDASAFGRSLYAVD
jgi:CheY-like chemotaxis protein